MPKQSPQLNDESEGCQTTEYDDAFSSVADFVGEISRLNRTSIHTLSPSVSSMTFYRGQANGEWRLSPKLYRVSPRGMPKGSKRFMEGSKGLSNSIPV